MKKIMFNDKYYLTQAVLDGRKTVTRRVIPHSKITGQIASSEKITLYKNYDGSVIEPFYKVGEVVAIAQRYADFACSDRFDDCEVKELINSKGWGNKMFIKSELMPHQIQITDICLECLQEITEEDCLKEGIMETKHKDVTGNWNKYYWHHGVTNDNCHHGQYIEYKTAKEAFSSLIDKTSGKGTWESNPYVWRYEFELIQ